MQVFPFFYVIQAIWFIFFLFFLFFLVDGGDSNFKIILTDCVHQLCSFWVSVPALAGKQPVWLRKALLHCGSCTIAAKGIVKVTQCEEKCTFQAAAAYCLSCGCAPRTRRGAWSKVWTQLIVAQQPQCSRFYSPSCRLLPLWAEMACNFLDGDMQPEWLHLHLSADKNDFL